MNNKKRVFFPWPIAIAAAALVVSIATFGVNYYNNKFNTTGVTSGVSMVFDFTSGRTVNVIDMHPSRGNLYLGVKQKSGTLGTKYTAKYKLNTASSYTTAWNLTFNNNTNAEGPLYLTAPNGSNKYNFQIVKTNNASKASKLDVDLFLK